MGHRTAAEGYRVLISAPMGRDAESVAALLAGQGYDALICQNLPAIAAALDAPIGAVLVTEEALSGDLGPLTTAIKRQPPWSDVPFILLASRRTGIDRPAEALRQRLSDVAPNTIVLERPLGSASLVSTIASAMRSRQKQFEMRDKLAELARGREALERSEAELRRITDALPVLVGFVDTEFRYRFANEAYQEWFGRPAAAMIGRRVTEVISPADFEPRRERMERALAGEPSRFELAWPRPDGSRRIAEIRYLPRLDRDGRVDGFSVFALDITDRKDAEEELERRVRERTAALDTEMASRLRAEEALRQSQKMEAVGQLTGGIAHDFNNMLTGVIGALDIIKRRLANGRTDGLDRLMDAASSSAQRAAGLTARLLAFSRRQSLDPQPVDVGALSVSLEDLVRRTLTENIALRVIPGADVPKALADSNQLENAILNLAINARDAMPDGGLLTIETSLSVLDEAYALAVKPEIAPGRYVMVAVSDTGVGMSPDLLDKVFEPFFTTKPIGQGTGLGLSMVYGFARQSGGQVRIHSEPGRGTSVKIYLPVSPDTDAAPGSGHEVLREGRGQTVLLVEDDPSVRLLVREVLEELSYRAIEAGNADAAIPILQSERTIDLMISDVGLPGMNGRQLAEIARQHRPTLPILFITGYAENAAIRAGFLGTNMTMITKPFAMDALSAKIADIMDGG